MKTDCSKKSFEFQPLFSKKILSAFDGGHITSDGGALLLRAVERFLPGRDHGLV